MAIQPALLAAVHEHPDAVVTRTPALPPADVKLLPLALSAYVQAVAPDCVTVWVCPAIVRVPTRELLDVLAATV
jgi:hypothetical protein